MAWLLRYHWPGNVRELQNLVECACVLACGPQVEIDAGRAACTGAAAPAAVATSLREVERAHIRHTLDQTGWVVEGRSGAAALLGLEPSTLRYRMQKLGLKRPRSGAAAMESN